MFTKLKYLALIDRYATTVSVTYRTSEMFESGRVPVRAHREIEMLTFFQMWERYRGEMYRGVEISFI